MSKRYSRHDFAGSDYDIGTAIEEETYTFDGTQSIVMIEHNKNRKVIPVYYTAEGVIAYPVYDQLDPNVLCVMANMPLTGTLILL